MRTKWGGHFGRVENPMTHSRHPSPFRPIPPVYPFRDRELRNRFLQLVRERLARGGRHVVIENGMARVEGEFCVHGLSNLAGTCHMAPPAMCQVAGEAAAHERSKRRAVAGVTTAAA